MKLSSIALAVVLAACSTKEAPSAQAPPPTGVRLLHPGSEPRQLLRYHLTRGATHVIELALDVDINASGQAAPLPTLVMTSEIVADDVLADGSAQVRTTITDVTARDRPGSAISATQMAEQTQLMRGLVLRGTLAPEGTLRDFKVDAAGRILPPGLTSQLDTLSKSFEQVAMPLPGVPVGAGASWMSTRTLSQSGMVMTTTTTFTLRAIDGDELQFESVTLVSGKDQAVGEGSARIEVSKISGNGSGKGTVDLSRMSMAGELLAELSSVMSAQGETTQMAMKMATRLSPAPAPAATVPSDGSASPREPGSSVAPAPASPQTSPGSAVPPAGPGSAVAPPAP